MTQAQFCTRRFLNLAMAVIALGVLSLAVSPARATVLIDFSAAQSTPGGPQGGNHWNTIGTTTTTSLLDAASGLDSGWDITVGMAAGPESGFGGTGINGNGDAAPFDQSFAIIDGIFSNRANAAGTSTITLTNLAPNTLYNLKTYSDRATGWANSVISTTVGTGPGGVTLLKDTVTSFNIESNGAGTLAFTFVEGPGESATIGDNSVLNALRVAALPTSVSPTPLVLIDINDAQGVPAGPDLNGNFWNATTVELDNIPLVDTTNAATGWTFHTRELPVAGDTGLSGGLNSTTVPPAPYNIQEAYADSWFDNANGGGMGEFSFTGLDPASEYELVLFGGRSSGGGVDGIITFTAGTAAGSPFNLPHGVLVTFNATPNASGVLTFTLDGTGNVADLNLLSIQQLAAAVPEPSSAALAALGLTALIARRRRGRRA